MMDASMLIARAARYYADKTAVVDGERRYSFQEINARVNRLTHALFGLGMERGDVLATLANNSSFHIEAYFAAIKGGFVRVHLNPRLTPENLADQLNDAQAKIILVAEEYLERVADLKSRFDTVRHIISFRRKSPPVLEYEPLLARASPQEPGLEHEDEDLGCLWYTSGTTGKPKGVMLARRSDTAVMRNYLMDPLFDLAPGDNFLPLQPLYHGAGLFILPSWVRGCTQVTIPHYDPEFALPVIAREKITVIKTVPTVLLRLLAQARGRGESLRTVRTLAYGGSPMPVAKLEEGIELLGPIFLQIYGQAEALGAITCLGKKEHGFRNLPGMNKLGSAGRPFTMVNVRVVNEEGQELPAGESGEVIVTGDHIMTGYWKLPREVVEQKLRRGWIHTGDIGHMDGDGYLFLVDRKSEMIVSGGLNIYPSEVEQVLYRHPGVAAAAVVGVPDEAWGETVKAVIVRKAGREITEAEIIDFCKQHLPGYKRPTSVDFVDILPSSPEGKVLRRVVRETYWQGKEKRVH